MTRETERGGLSKDSYISIGLAVLLMGGALVVNHQISSVREDILPALSSVSTEVRAIGRDITRIEGTLIKMNDDLRSQIRRIEQRVETLEARIK